MTNTFTTAFFINIRCLACALMIGLLTGCDESPEKLARVVNIHIKQAESYIKSGQYRAATIEAKNVIQKAPNSLDGFLLTAKILGEVGQYKTAIAVLDNVPETLKSDNTYLIAKARAYQNRGKFRSALDILESNQSVANESPEIFALLKAKSLEGLGQNERAANHYRKILSKDPQNTSALLGLVSIAIKQSDLSTAEQHLLQLESIDQTNVEANLLRAQLSLDEQDLDQAENYLSEALIKLKDADTLTPKKAGVLKVLADVLVKQGRSAEALIYTKLLAEAFPGYEVAEEQYANAFKHFQDGELEKAKEILQAILADYPNYETASLLLAIVNYQQGDYADATAQLNPAVDPEIAHPDITRLAALSNLRSNQPLEVLRLLDDYAGTQQDAKLLAIYGGAAMAANLRQKAEIALQKAVRLDKNNLPAYAALAKFYASETPPQTEKAIQYLEQAYTLDRSNSAIASQLVKQLVGANRFDDANHIVTTQLNKAPSSTASLELAGNFHVAKKAYQEARAFYEKALSIKPDNYPLALKLAELSALTDADFLHILKHYDRAIDIDPVEPLAYRRLLLVAEKFNAVQSVDEHINQIRVATGRDEGLAVLTIYYAGKKELTKAQAMASMISADSCRKDLYDASQLNFYFAKALDSVRNNDTRSAKESIFSALRIEPDSLRLLTLLTEIEIDAGNNAEAEKLIFQIDRLSKVMAMQLNASLAESQGNYAAAIEKYRDAWQTSPSELLATRYYALLEKQQPGAAKPFLKDWLSKNPNSIPALMSNARDLLVGGQFRQAISLMDRVSAIEPENVTNLNNLAWAQQQIGDKSALDTARKAFELAPDIANVADTYGWILYQNGAIEQSIEILRQAAKLDPTNDEIRQHLETAQRG